MKKVTVLNNSTAILGLRINKYDLFQCRHIDLFARDDKFINSVH